MNIMASPRAIFFSALILESLEESAIFSLQQGGFQNPPPCKIGLRLSFSGVTNLEFPIQKSRKSCINQLELQQN